MRTLGTDMVVVSPGSFYNLSQHPGSRAAAHLGIWRQRRNRVRSFTEYKLPPSVLTNLGENPHCRAHKGTERNLNVWRMVFNFLQSGGRQSNSGPSRLPTQAADCCCCCLAMEVQLHREVHRTQACTTQQKAATTQHYKKELEENVVAKEISLSENLKSEFIWRRVSLFHSISNNLHVNWFVPHP